MAIGFDASNYASYRHWCCLCRCVSRKRWLVPAMRPFFKMPDPILVDSMWCNTGGRGLRARKRRRGDFVQANFPTGISVALPNLRLCRFNSWIVFRSLSALADCCKCANSRRTG